MKNNNSIPVIVALFSKSSYALQPWAEAGYTCLNYDDSANAGYYGNPPQYYDAYNLFFWKDLIKEWDSMKVRPALIIAFPPCDDLAVCGAKHFKAKREKDPQFQVKAMELFAVGEKLAKYYGCPCLTENPTSVASTLYRKPEIIISPHEYGGYLPKNDIHPEYPNYIAPRDAYRKKTFYWLINGMQLAPARPVPLLDTGVKSKLGKAGNSKQFLKLGGKSAKTKTIRSITPRSPFIALFQTMEPIVKASIIRGTTKQ